VSTAEARDPAWCPTDPTDAESCPGCDATHGVQRTTGTSPRVQAWSCTTCQTKWAITTVNPQPYLDRLAATVEQLGAARFMLRQVIALADDAPGLTDRELRDRLLALAEIVRPMSWFLRSISDQDTHRGELHSDGTVAARCGIRFPPRLLPGGLALPGHPQDRDQICPECQRAGGAR